MLSLAYATLAFSAPAAMRPRVPFVAMIDGKQEAAAAAVVTEHANDDAELIAVRAALAQMKEQKAELEVALERSIRIDEAQRGELDELYEDLQTSEAALATGTSTIETMQAKLDAATDQISVLEARGHLHIVGAKRAKAESDAKLAAMRCLLEKSASGLTAFEADKRRSDMRARVAVLAAVLVNEALARFTSLARATCLLTAICAAACVNAVRHPSPVGRLKGSIESFFPRGPVDAPAAGPADVDGQATQQLSAVEVKTEMVGRVVPTSMLPTVIPGVASKSYAVDARDWCE